MIVANTNKEDEIHLEEVNIMHEGIDQRNEEPLERIEEAREEATTNKSLFFIPLEKNSVIFY